MFFKIGVLKNFHNIHRKTRVLESLFSKKAGLCWSLFLIRLKAWKPKWFVTLLKRNSNTGVFLWILSSEFSDLLSCTNKWKINEVKERLIKWKLAFIRKDIWYLKGYQTAPGTRVFGHFLHLDDLQPLLIDHVNFKSGAHNVKIGQVRIFDSRQKKIYIRLNVYPLTRNCLIDKVFWYFR